MENPTVELKKMRMKRGITLEEVHKKTKIHVSILKAIEGDAVTGINPIYLKSFIKIYCKYLGVDPDLYIPKLKDKQPVSFGPLVRGGPVESREKKPDPVLSAAPKKLGFKMPKINFKAIVYAGVTGFLLFGLFSLGRFIATRPKALPVPVKQAKVKPAPIIKKAVAPKAATIAVTAVTPQKAVTAVTEIRLSIYAREKCWVELKADGRMVYRGRLEKGRSESWKAKDKMELTLGDAGAVELQVNDQRFTNLGRRGTPRKNIIITKEGLR